METLNKTFTISADTVYYFDVQKELNISGGIKEFTILSPKGSQTYKLPTLDNKSICKIPIYNQYSEDMKIELIINTLGGNCKNGYEILNDPFYLP